MTLSRSKPRPKACGWCAERFDPQRMGQKCCSPRCAVAYNRARAARDAHRAIPKPGAGKPPGDRRTALRRCQTAFNAYIRERDRDLPCITCGTLSPGGDPRGGVWDCGHYLTVGAHPELRFDPDNAARQCKRCNRDRSGAQQAYREALIVRIGQARLDALEGLHPPAKWTLEEINGLAAGFRRQLRELKAQAV